MDLQAEGKQVDQSQLENIHRNKTGALIQAAIMMAAVTIFNGTDQAIPQLRQYGQAIGLAFQVQDDILDIVSETEVLGKTAGKDEQVEKSTYPALMGLNRHSFMPSNSMIRLLVRLNILERLLKSSIQYPASYCHVKARSGQ